MGLFALPVSPHGLSVLLGEGVPNPQPGWVEAAMDVAFGPLPGLAADALRNARGSATEAPAAVDDTTSRAGARASGGGGYDEPSYPEEAASPGTGESRLPWIAAGALMLGALIYLAVGIDRKDKR